MTKEVLIHIKGLQMLSEAPGQAPEPVELITAGEYYYRNQTHYLLYDEMMEDFPEPTHTMIKIRPGMMEVRKKGLINVDMLFEKGKKTMAYYRNPLGLLEMQISAARIMMAEAASWMEIQADYAMVINGSPSIDCRMQIRISEKGNRNAAVFFRQDRDSMA